MNKVYVLLDEDRGQDTEVYIYFNKGQAVKHFNEIVLSIKECIVSSNNHDIEDENVFYMHDKYHLAFDIDDSWGNIRIYQKQIKKGNK